MQMDTSRKKGNSRLLIGVIGCLILTALFGWMAWASLNCNPDVVIPTAVLPSRNAYDYYVRAKDTVKPITYHGRKVNVIFSILMASGALEPSYPSDEKAAFVKANAPALRLLREGFAYDCQLTPIRSFGAQSKQFAPFGRLARLLLLDGEIKAAVDDWNQSLQSDLDAIQLGQDLSRGGGLGAFMEGDYYQRFGQQAAETTVERLTSTEAREAAQRLEGILARHALFHEVLQEEKWQIQAQLMGLFRMADWRSQLIGDRSDETIQRRVGHWKWYLISKKEILDSCTQYLDRWIANAAQPYAAHAIPPPLPDNEISRYLVFDYSRTWNRDAQIQAGNVLLLLRLALRAYRLEHGRYPATLKALPPSYLKRLPDDPFAMQGSFNYENNGNAYSLSSSVNSGPGICPQILSYP